MSDIRETGYNLPITNFTEANASNNSPAQYYDFERNINRGRKRRRELNFLTKKNNQYFNSRVPVVDLTVRNGQFVNRRIPVIDLTEEDVMDITDQIQCIDLTNDDSSRNNHPNHHFELKRKIDSSSNGHSNRQFELTQNDDSLSTSHLHQPFKLSRNSNSSGNNHPHNHLELESTIDSSSNSHSHRQFELTRNDDSLNTSHLNHHFELSRNGDSSNNSHLNHPFELARTSDSSSNSNLTHHFELSRNSDSSSNRNLTHHFELTKNSNSSSNSRLNHHFQITRNNDSLSSSHPNHHFEITGNDDSSSNSRPNHQVELTRNGRDTDIGTERFNLADNGGQNFIPNVPSSDLTCYNGEFANYRISDRTHNNAQNVSHQLQYTGMTDGRQQRNVNECIPTTTLTYDIGQTIDQNIPPIHLTSIVNFENYNRPIFNPPPENIVHNAEGLNLTDQFKSSSETVRNDTVNKEPIDIAGMYDAEVRSCNNLPADCSKQALEFNTIIPFETPRYDMTELNILKRNEASNMRFMQISTCSSLQQHQCKKEKNSKNSQPHTNCYHQKHLRPGKHEKISAMNPLDLMKSADHPIPFRHSLGRSTVNTSKNVPIESTEASKSGSRKMTVSSTLRRKKAKSTSAISKQNLSNSLESASRAGTLSFGAVKEFFLKFWIILIFLWVFYIFLRYFTVF